MKVMGGLMIAAAPSLWTDVLVLSQNCTAEMATCEDDITCATCYNNATMDGTCDRNATDCAGVADYYCCVAGDACSNNTLLVDYINCGIELDSCTLTDVCHYDNTTAAGGDDDDWETCPFEYAACQNDTTCAACYNNATMDGTCDRNATDCAGVANYYCCVAGDACSNNTLLVDYINCGIELDSCTLTDVCNYDYTTVGAGGEGEVDDMEACPTELAACLNDTACAGCYNTTTTDMTCDRDATDCTGVAAVYCCLAGDACSNNTLLVDYINCEIEVESCIFTDVCNYTSPTPSAEVPGETPPPDINGESGSHTYPRSFGAGIFVGVTAMLLTQQLY